VIESDLPYESASASSSDCRHSKAGWLLALVGASGVGKDTLLSELREHFQQDDQVHIATRIITRPLQPGAEQHQAVDHAVFEQWHREARFAVSWTAHGLHYALSACTRRLIAEKGAIVIANGSRSALPQIRNAYPRTSVVHLTARPELLAERLKSRGRESRADIVKRLSRNQALQIEGPNVREIENNGEVSIALRAMVEQVKTSSARRSLCA